MTYTPDITTRTTDPLDEALALMARAEEHGLDARAARIAGDHSRAGTDREEQRACMKRAELLVAFSSATSLQRIADAAEREALRR